MARIRSIKPEFFTSETVASLPLSTRLTFIGLWTYVDDNGVGLDNEMLITAAIWPLESDHAGTLNRTQGDLKLLTDAGLIDRYESSRNPREDLAKSSRKTPPNGKPPSRKRLLHVTSWSEHQKVDHPRLPRYPTPDEATDRALPASENSDPRPSVAKTSREPRETVAPEQGSGIRDQGSGSRAKAPRHAVTTADALPGSPPRPETVTERTNRLTRVYTDQVPLVKYEAAMTIVRRAVDANLSDDVIAKALQQLASRKQTLTLDRLRETIYGPGNGRSASHQPWQNPDESEYDKPMFPEGSR